MTARDFAGWRRYYDHQPFGTLRENLHAALIARAAYKGPIQHPPSLSDLMLKSKSAQRADLMRVQSDDEMKAAMNRLGRVTFKKP